MGAVRQVGRALAALLAAGSLGLAVSMVPAAADIRPDDPAHNWNQQYLPLAKQDFHTKQKANQRFISNCEPGSIAAGARVEPAELASSFQDVSGLPSGAAFECTGGLVTVRRDGVGRYTWRVRTSLLTPAVQKLMDVESWSWGESSSPILDTVTGLVGTDGGIWKFQVRTNALMEEEGIFYLVPADPQVVGFTTTILGDVVI